MIMCEIKVQSGGFKTTYTGLFEKTSDAALDAIKKYMKDGKHFSFSVEALTCNTKRLSTGN